MPTSFRGAVSGQTLRKKLSSTVYKAGTKQRFTAKSFQKSLQQSSNPLLRRKLGFNKTGTIKKHEALKTAEAFYKEAAEKKETYRMDEYKLKREGLKVEDGKISKISSQRMYQSMAQEEMKAEAPTGPSKEELEKEKNRQRALAQLNKWRRAREIELEEKQKAQSKGALGNKTGPQGPQTAGASRGQSQARHLNIPTMAQGSIKAAAHPSDASQQLSEQVQAQTDDDTVNPLISRLKEESGIAAPQQDDGNDIINEPAVAEDRNPDVDEDVTEEVENKGSKKAA